MTRLEELLESWGDLADPVRRFLEGRSEVIPPPPVLEAHPSEDEPVLAWMRLWAPEAHDALVVDLDDGTPLSGAACPVLVLAEAAPKCVTPRSVGALEAAHALLQALADISRHPDAMRVTAARVLQRREGPLVLGIPEPCGGELRQVARDAAGTTMRCMRCGHTCVRDERDAVCGAPLVLESSQGKLAPR